jgi:hypothetical protein
MSKKNIPVSVAGKHYVVYKLLMKGYPVGFSRANSQGIDLVINDREGNNAVSIQVLTSITAWVEYTRKPANNHWEWPISLINSTLDKSHFFYAFVDLKFGNGIPDVYVVPFAAVAEKFKPGFEGSDTVWIMTKEKAKFLAAWHLIGRQLKAKKAVDKSTLSLLTLQSQSLARQ